MNDFHSKLWVASISQEQCVDCGPVNGDENVD